MNRNGKKNLHIGILGGGPSALFMYKRLVELNHEGLEITIIEKNHRLGAGMPYSEDGANDEHVTNVSDNEIPRLTTSVKDWMNAAPADLIKRFNIKPANFNEYKVMPRLLFGEYLSSQFELLQKQARKAGITTHVLLDTLVTDLMDDPEQATVTVVAGSGTHIFDVIILCSGHNWPMKNEQRYPNYFDSPYPPSKLAMKVNYPVAIRGSSLTAIDAVRTLARKNGEFIKNDDGSTSYKVAKESKDFRLVLHSINGVLPAIRFHLEDSQLSRNSAHEENEFEENKKANEGFVALDYIFENKFKEPIREKDPKFYETIRDMRIEEFVDHVMSLRERLDPFLLFKAEYAEAEKSIARRQSVYWKEMLAILSFTMNYPAKHLSAEDMTRLKKVLMPLISIVIAFVPQSSCLELLALYDAGILSLVAVDGDSKVIPREEGGAIYHYTDEQGQPISQSYNLFVDCIGQPHLSFEDFPFKGLPAGGSISAARLKFRSREVGEKTLKAGNPDVEQDEAGDYYLRVPGITINDYFQVLDKYGAYSNRIYIMAVPYIGGYNPDYSGLDFCEAASGKILEGMVNSELFSKRSTLHVQRSTFENPSNDEIKS